MSRTPRSTVERTRRRSVAAVLVVVVVAFAGCGDDDDPADGVAADPQQVIVDAEEEVARAQAEVEAATEQFCGDTSAYVEAIDRYAKVLDDDVATVSDVRTAGADLVSPREQVSAAADAVVDAEGALQEAEQDLADARASAAGSTASSSTSSTTEPVVAPGTVDRVEQAEEDLTEVAASLDDQTPVVEAAASFNAAAVALEVAWVAMLDDAGCLTDERRAELSTAVREHTTAVQTALTTAGYYAGAVDGIYGPETVAAVEQLQSDSGLVVTGYVDRATAEALDVAVSAVQDAADDEVAALVAGLQAVMKLAGAWDGPVDGQWSEELSTALGAMQAELGVEPTGVLDAATISALQGAVADGGSSGTTTPDPAGGTDGTQSTTTAAPSTDETEATTTTSPA